VKNEHTCWAGSYDHEGNSSTDSRVVPTLFVTPPESRRFQPSGSRDPPPPLLRPAQAWLRPAQAWLRPAQAWLSLGSGRLTLLTRRGAVKTSHQKSLTFNEGPERCPILPSQGSRIYGHCAFHNHINRWGDLSRLPLAFASSLASSLLSSHPSFYLSSYPSSHLSIYLSSLFYLFDPSFISLIRSFFFVTTLDIYIRAFRTLYIINTEQAKGCWRGLNLNEQIEAALKNRLFKNKFKIDSNFVYRELALFIKPRYVAIIKV
jgi:hypothetical protein